MSWYLLAVIPVLGLLVLVHEFGHFITAKWAGIRVEEFGLGFPPALVSIRKRDQGGWEVMWLGNGRDLDTANTQNPFTGTVGGVSQKDGSTPPHTIYSLNLLPIGGFVRMPGETGDVEDEYGKYDQHSFAAKSAGKRIIVLCAGVVMNIILAAVLFTIAYGMGEPTIPNVIGSVQPNSPAAAVGIRAGDTIVSVNGKSVSTFDDMHTIVTQAVTADNGHHATVKVKIVFKHAGQTGQETKDVNARTHPGPNQGALGVLGKIVTVKYPLWQAPFKGLSYTYETSRAIVTALGQMVTGAIKPQLAGPVGIAQMTGDVAQAVPTIGWFPILSLTAMLSVNLAIVNILPLPALDGGRIVLILIEILRGGKRMKPEREGLINFIGFAALLILLIIVTVSDVMHWAG